MATQNGKGSKRRPEDSKKIADNWDRIFKRPEPIKEPAKCPAKPE